MFLNKILNFNNPVSLTCESLRGVSLVLGWCLGFFSVFLSFFLSFPPPFALWWMKVLKLAVGMGSGVWGSGVLESSQKGKNLPNWLLMLDLLLLQWGVLWFCFPSLMLKQKLYPWATVFGMGVFQL